jgi:Protein kinase domain
MRSFPLDEYEQRVPIRIGSLSQCFAAQTAAGEEVLLKQLLPAFARVPSVASAWLARAEENSRLDHPGCTKVLDWGEALGESYLTLPVVAAVSLRELLSAAAKAGVWPSAEAVIAVAVGALSALAHAHAECALLHLDLDPHSVLLRKDGTVLLTEFGMWRALPAEAATRERFDRGRVAYLCPELTKSLDGDARSDVFSLGAILYELIGRERPFHGATQLVTAMAIAEGRRRALRELAPQAPEVLCDIVETMLGQLPEERFQTAQAALGALSSCCQPDPAALVDWLERLELRAGPQAGFARAPRRAPTAPATQVAAARGAAPGAGRPEDALAGAAPPLLGAAASSASPLPPPLLVPPAPLAASAARAPDVAPADDWLAPPPLLAPGRAPAAFDAGPHASAAGAAGASAAGAAGPTVRDGRTAFLDTGAARDALARSNTLSPPDPVSPAAPRPPDPVFPPAARPAAAARLANPQTDAAPRPPALIGAPVPPARLGEMVTRDTPIASTAPPARPLALGTPSLAGTPKPLLGALPPVSLPPKPLVSSLPPLEHDAPHGREKRGWQEPSKTVFQVRAFAKHATRRSDARSPLLVIVLLSVAFGFAVVAGGALLWRLLAS